MDRITAGFYARVSSDGQTRGNTVASQVAALRERSTADDAVVGPDHSYVDEGWSGTVLARPALERMRDAIAAGELDRIYVLAPDRLARRYAYQVLLVEEFRRAGVEVVFLNRAIGGSAEDDLLLQVQGMIAEYERARILERSRRGRRHAALSGSVSALCAVPYGYRYFARLTAGGMAQVEVVDEEAHMVRQLFDWVGIEQISLRDACRRLRALDCPTRTGLTRWDATTLSGMLRNPAYQGTAMFGRTRATAPAQPRLRSIRGHPQPSRHPSGSSPVPRAEWITIPVPAIVDVGVFEAAQAQLDENRRRKREGRRRPGWLLQGLVVCRLCGYAFYGKMARGLVGDRRPADYGYYRCTGTDAHRYGGDAPCSNRSVRSDKLEQAVWQQVQAVLDDPKRVAGEHERRIVAARDGGTPGNVGVFDRQIVRLRHGVDRLIDGYAEGIIDSDEFKPRLAGLKARLTRLQSERETALATQDAERDLQLVLGRIDEFAQRVRAGLDGLDWHGRRDVIRTLVRRIEIDRDQVEIVFRVPGSTPDDNGRSPPSSNSSAGPEQTRQHCGRNHGRLVGEDADDVGATLHLLVQPFDRVGRMELRPMRLGKRHEGDDVDFGLVHHGRQFRDALAQLIGDLSPGLRCGGMVGLHEHRPDGACHHLMLGLRHIGQSISHEVNATPLPRCLEDLGDGGLQTFMRVRDDELDALSSSAFPGRAGTRARRSPPPTDPAPTRGSRAGHRC